MTATVRLPRKGACRHREVLRLLDMVLPLLMGRIIEGRTIEAEPSWARSRGVKLSMRILGVYYMGIERKKKTVEKGTVVKP